MATLTIDYVVAFGFSLLPSSVAARLRNQLTFSLLQHKRTENFCFTITKNFQKILKNRKKM